MNINTEIHRSCFQLPHRGWLCCGGSEAPVPAGVWGSFQTWWSWGRVGRESLQAGPSHHAEHLHTTLSQHVITVNNNKGVFVCEFIHTKFSDASPSGLLMLTMKRSSWQRRKFRSSSSSSMRFCSQAFFSRATYRWARRLETRMKGLYWEGGGSCTTGSAGAGSVKCYILINDFEGNCAKNPSVWL